MRLLGAIISAAGFVLLAVLAWSVWFYYQAFTGTSGPASLILSPFALLILCALVCAGGGAWIAATGGKRRSSNSN